MAEAVGRHLEAILEERDHPADADGQDEGFGLKILQMAVPGVGHEDVREKQQTQWSEFLHATRRTSAWSGADCPGSKGGKSFVARQGWGC
jgi:hypothetical protein